MRIREFAKFLDDVENRRKGLRIWIVLVLLWSITRTQTQCKLLLVLNVTGAWRLLAVLPLQASAQLI